MKRTLLALAVLAGVGCRGSARERPAPAPSASAPPRSDASAAPSSSAAPPSPACPLDGWPTYQHDAARTGASRGCVRGAWRVAWSYAPTGSSGREAVALHAVATDGLVAVAIKKGNSPALHALDPQTGAPRWEHDTRADIERPSWPSIALGSVVLNDDGFYLLDPSSGKPRWDRGLDTWGQSLSDGASWFLTNTWHVEGPGVYAGAFDASGKTLWKANKYGSVKEDVMDDVGAIALDGATLVHAANYKFAPHSALSALDAATGRTLWRVATVPASDVSIGHGLTYAVERAKRGAQPRLVARRLTSGDVEFAVPVAAPASWAPVVAGGLVVTALDGTTLLAVRATSGDVVYRVSVEDTLPTRVPASTAALAALGSDTLVVTAGSKVLAFELSTGAPRGVIATELPDARDPVLVGRRLYVGTRGRLVALAPID